MAEDANVGVSDQASDAVRADVTSPTTNALPLASPVTAASPQYGEDLMEQFGLGEVLNDLRSRKLRSSFSHYITEIAAGAIPMKPRCPAGSLVEIAQQPVNEDERRLEFFDERVLRNALTLKETEEKPGLPEWLEIEQPWGDEERKRKRRDKKKKRKKKKRKRNAEGGGEGEERGEDDERRAKKKRKQPATPL